MLPACLPSLTGASFITHGMNTKRISAIYRQISGEYKSKCLSFSGMISLDGVSSVHDAVRGIPGAFERTTKTFFELSNDGIDVSACCTIVRANATHLDELLDWCQEHHVPIRFRIGEFIRRLNNDSCSAQIRSFDDGEQRSIVCFFHRLLQEYEKSDSVRRTYRSILHMLTGGPRLIDCPYRAGDAINIDSQSRFSICAPKGKPRELRDDPIIDIALAAQERIDIASRDCRNCIHDYHAEWLPDAPQRDENDPVIWSRLYGTEPSLSETCASSAPAPRPLSESATTLITGWYGTETVGDIAILRGILQEYRDAFPDMSFHICSLNPEWTRQTVIDMPAQLRSAVRSVVSYGGSAAATAMDACDAMLVAGGPLMDIPDMRLLSCLSDRFRTAGKTVIVEGCGLGPLRNESHIASTCKLLANAHEITLRDSASAAFAQRLCPQLRCSVRRDPAVTCLQSIQRQHAAPPGSAVRTFLRAPGAEYPVSCSAEQASSWLARLIKILAGLVDTADVDLYPMNTLWAGGDDRIFSRGVASQLGPLGLHATVIVQPQTPETIVDAMAAAGVSLCMRYHSVVFATSLRVPFIPIDYTGGGKIASFLRDEGFDLPPLRLGDETDLRTDLLAKHLEASRSL